MIITIDGPARSGKGTLARRLAEHLGFYYLETGLLYRAVAYIVKNIFHKDLKAFLGLSAQERIRLGNLVYSYEFGLPRICFEGHILDQEMLCSSHEIAQGASIVAALSCVREALIDVQREIAQHYDIVADGRDCGSVVFPDADYKFFITASLEERARREVGVSHISLAEATRVIQERDVRDASREVAPLVVPTDAIVIDTTGLDKDGCFNEVLKYINQEPGKSYKEEQ